MGRVTGALVGALLALTLAGCGAPPSGGARPEPEPAAADVRARLAAALSEESEHYAAMVEDPATTVTLVEATWLTRWQVFDVLWRGPYHPQRFYAALSDDDTVLVLSGHPEAFAQMTANAQVQVDDASVAVDIAVFYLDTTRSFQAYSYRIDSVSDISWLPHPDAGEQQRRTEVETQYGPLVAPPAAEPSEDGWTVTVWMVDDRTLVRHQLEIAPDGAVGITSDIVETDIPVPYSI